MKTITKGISTMEADDTVISEIKAKDAKGISPGFNAAGPHFPKLRIQKLGDGGHLNTTQRSRDEGEIGGLVHFEAIRFVPTPRTGIHWMKQKIMPKC